MEIDGILSEILAIESFGEIAMMIVEISQIYARNVDQLYDETYMALETMALFGTASCAKKEANKKAAQRKKQMLVKKRPKTEFGHISLELSRSCITIQAGNERLMKGFPPKGVYAEYGTFCKIQLFERNSLELMGFKSDFRLNSNLLQVSHESVEKAVFPASALPPFRSAQDFPCSSLNQFVLPLEDDDGPYTSADRNDEACQDTGFASLLEDAQRTPSNMNIIDEYPAQDNGAGSSFSLFSNYNPVEERQNQQLSNASDYTQLHIQDRVLLQPCAPLVESPPLLQNCISQEAKSTQDSGVLLQTPIANSPFEEEDSLDVSRNVSYLFKPQNKGFEQQDLDRGQLDANGNWNITVAVKKSPKKREFRKTKLIKARNRRAEPPKRSFRLWDAKTLLERMKTQQVDVEPASVGDSAYEDDFGNHFLCSSLEPISEYDNTSIGVNEACEDAESASVLHCETINADIAAGADEYCSYEHCATSVVNFDQLAEIEEPEEKPKFPGDVHNIELYKTEVLSWFQPQSAKLHVSKLAEHSKWKYDEKDICRLFVSTLHLANEGFVELHPVSESCEESINDFFIVSKF